MISQRLAFNGINGATGEYLAVPITFSGLSGIVRGSNADRDRLEELRMYYQRSSEIALGTREGVDVTDLGQTGWGVVFPQSIGSGVRSALKPLLDRRRDQAGSYYKELTLLPGESKCDLLVRHGIGPAEPADPDKVPYYLLIVGDPETVSYRFQSQLDVQYAVGRVCFDTLEEYASYAESVVEAEICESTATPHAVFFGVQNPDDLATRLSSEELVDPLAIRLAEVTQDKWEVRSVCGERATKTRLCDLVNGKKPPMLLFTASHGLGFPRGDGRQLRHQGALVCREWTGPVRWGKRPITPDCYFSEADIAESARLLGMIAFHFACYSIGTPHFDEFSLHSTGHTEEIAPLSFVSRLPQRLLGHRNGGALAVIGHVDRAWSYSFMCKHSGRQLAVFESVLRRLVSGYPVGSAVEYFNQRYAALSTELSSELEEIRLGKTADEQLLAAMWTANNDARNYQIFGDPAVRLPGFATK